MRKSRLSLRLVVCLFVGLCYEVPVMAETELSEQEASFNDEMLLFGDVPSVFSASKYEQKITEAPARISVVTADEIQRYGHRNLIDILNTLPGFQGTYDRYYNYVGTRGIGVLGDYNSRILLLIDGHRINENIYNGAVLDNGMVLDIDLIDRVEVVRGPASSVYGSSAFFGVINIISKRGRDFQGTEISVSAGSQSSYKGRISHGQRYDNGIELLMSVSGYDSKGDESIYFVEFDDPATNNGLAEGVDDSHNQNLFIKVSYGDYTMSVVYEEFEKAIPTGSYETIFNDARTRAWEGQAYLDLSYQHLLANGADVKARLFYDNNWYDGDWTYDYGTPASPDEVIFRDKAEGKWWGTELLISQQYFEKHYLILGLEYRNSLSEKQYQYDVYDTYLDINTGGYTIGTYIQDEYRIRDDLIFNMGIRYDYFSDISSSSTNPRIAVIWTPYEATNIKLLYGSAFRAPNAYELYYHDDGVTQKIPIKELKPETVKTYEIILEQRLSDNLNLTASIYQNYVEDMIVLVTDPADGLLVLENKDEAESIGAELELHGRWEDGWEGSVSYSNQKAEDGNGVIIVNSPRHMMKFNFILPIMGDDFSAGMEIQYESERKTLAGNETDSRIITNLTLFSREWIGGMKVSASVYNLLDETYAHPTSAEHLQDQIMQDGRTFRLKFDYTF